MENVLNFFNELPAWLNTATAIITAVSAITAATPSTTTNGAVNKTLKVLNFLAMNFGKNKNADDK